MRIRILGQWKSHNLVRWVPEQELHDSIMNRVARLQPNKHHPTQMESKHMQHWCHRFSLSEIRPELLPPLSPPVRCRPHRRLRGWGKWGGCWREGERLADRDSGREREGGNCLRSGGTAKPEGDMDGTTWQKGTRILFLGVRLTKFSLQVSSPCDEEQNMKLILGISNA